MTGFLKERSILEDWTEGGYILGGLPETAVIPAAGRGSRLDPFTSEMPKCLVEVSGVPILFRLLRQLAGYGISRVVIATGYKDREIIKAVGNVWEGISVEYVFNHDWSTTNNIVSVGRAAEKIETDFLLIESDLVLADSALDLIRGGNRIVLDRLQPGMTGTAVSLAGSGRVGEFVFRHDGVSRDELYKTVNIYSLNLPDFSEYVLPRLRRLINTGRTGIFYEYAIADAVRETGFSLKPVFFSENDWVEIDTPEDLAAAHRRFVEHAALPGVKAATRYRSTTDKAQVNHDE